MMFSGLADFIRYGLIGIGTLLKLNSRNAGPRYSAHSFPVSDAVTF
jgi:hypothetical protein